MANLNQLPPQENINQILDTIIGKGGATAANKRLAAARSAGFIAPDQCF